MPRLLDWVVRGGAHDLRDAGKAIVTGTPAAVGTIGRAARWTGHALGNLAAVPLVPVRLATKLVRWAPKTSAVIGTAVAGGTAYSALSSHHTAHDFRTDLQADDMALQQTAGVQDQMQMAQMMQPTYQMQEPMVASPTGPAAEINYADGPTNSIMAATADLHGPLMARQAPQMGVSV